MKTEIETLKQLRLEKGISYQAIVEQTEAIGHPLSLSTIRRVFTWDETHPGFRDDTLKAIKAAILTYKQSASEMDRIIARYENPDSQESHQLSENVVNAVTSNIIRAVNAALTSVLSEAKVSARLVLN